MSVLHPEPADVVVVEEKDHPRVGRQGLPVHQADLALLLRVGDLDRHLELAGSGLDHEDRAARRFLRGRLLLAGGRWSLLGGGGARDGRRRRRRLVVVSAAGGEGKDEEDAEEPEPVHVSILANGRRVGVRPCLLPGAAE